jgi:hypothetical protein
MAVTVEPALDALLAEVAAGHPVLVLQNLGLDWLPRWHYAVVIGYDLERQELVLRSGTERRRITPFGVFLNTWDRAERWGIVVLPPQTLPARARPGPWLEAASGLEALGKWQEARVPPPAGPARASAISEPAVGHRVPRRHPSNRDAASPCRRRRTSGGWRRDRGRLARDRHGEVHFPQDHGVSGLSGKAPGHPKARARQLVEGVAQDGADGGHAGHLVERDP